MPDILMLLRLSVRLDKAEDYLPPDWLLLLEQFGSKCFHRTYCNGAAEVGQLSLNDSRAQFLLHAGSPDYDTKNFTALAHYRTAAIAD